MESRMRGLFLLALILIPFVTAAQSVRLVGDSWPPYVDKTLPENGVAVALVTAAFQRAGYDPVFEVKRWSSALEGGKAGLYDGIVAIWYSDERNQTLHFSEPYLENPVYFVKRRGSPVVFSSIDDMKNYRIGAVKDFEYGEIVEPLRGSMQYSNYVVQMLLGVVSGQLDLAIVEQRVASYEMNRYMSNQAKDLQFIEPPVMIQGLRVAISRANPDHEKIIADFNAAIAEMREDGSFASIFANYELR